MSQVRRRRQVWPQPVLNRISELVVNLENPSAKRIHAQLLEDFPNRRADVPSERTIYNIRASLPGRPDGDDSAWSLVDGDPEEARLALPVMREMNRSVSGGTLGWNLSKDLVRWIALVRTADPEIPLREAFFQALRYLQAERGLSPASEADRYLVQQLYLAKETLR